MNIGSNFFLRFFIFGGVVALIANSSGVPQAVTQAPGETGFSCNACHTPAGNYSPTISLDIMDQDSTVVTGYTPGQKYILQINIAGQNNPKAYGFQMVSLANTNNADMGVWSNLGTKVKQQNLLNRKYLVQSGAKSDGKFTMQWQAPETDKDTISFYFAGLAINQNGNTGGDSHTVGKLALPVISNVSSVTEQNENTKSTIFPNPATTYLHIKNINGSSYEVYNLMGKSVLSQKIIADKIDIQSLSVGTYVLAVRDANNNIVSTHTFVKQ